MAAVADTVVSVTAFPTDAVYAIVSDANAGIRVTPLNNSALRLASPDPARVTTRARQFEQILQVHMGRGALGAKGRIPGVQLFVGSPESSPV